MLEQEDVVGLWVEHRMGDCSLSPVSGHVVSGFWLRNLVAVYIYKDMDCGLTGTGWDGTCFFFPLS